MSDIAIITRRGLLVGSAAAAAAAAVPAAFAPAVETAAAAPVSKLVAFAVLEPDEWTGTIFFAETETEAMRLAANRDGEAKDYDGYEVRREPWADRYAETERVPAGAAAERGWRFECCGCDRNIDDYECVDEDEDGNEIVLEALPYDGVIGNLNGGLVFCSQPCKDRYDAIEARRAAVGAEFVDALKARVVALFGPVEFVDREHTYVVDHERGSVFVVQEAHVSFSFPGQKYGPATYQLRRPDSVRTTGSRWVDPTGPHQPRVSCCSGDVLAFNAWVGTEMLEVPAWLKQRAEA